jgi:amino acid transporter
LILAALAIFLEYASLFPNRSGGQVAYLEQAYPKPAFFFPVTYAFFTVAFSFSSSNAVVLARYIYRAAGYQAGEWANKGLAIASYTFLAFICLISTRWSIRLMNLISAIKLIILLFIVITGFVVLGGGTKVKDPRQNFRNSFDGVTNNGHDIVNALVSINFAYDGYYNAFNVVNEIRVCSSSARKTELLTESLESLSVTEDDCSYILGHSLRSIRSSKRRIFRCRSCRRNSRVW